MPESLVVDSARDFLDRVELLEVGCFELLGIRGALDDDGDRRVTGPGQMSDWELGGEDHELGVYWLEGGGRLLVRLSVELTGNLGVVRVGMQAEWDIGDMTRDDVTPRAEEDFINRVAVMTLLPYLRAGVSETAAKTLSASLTMSHFRPGDLSFKNTREVTDKNHEPRSVHVD